MRRSSHLVAAGLAVVCAASGCAKIESLWKGNAAPAATPATKPGAKTTPGSSKAAVDGGTLGHNDGAAGTRPTRPAAAPEKAWTPPPAHARGTLFSRLPKGTLFALRLPDVARLVEAYQRSAIPTFLQNALVAQQRAQFDEMLAHAKAELLPRLGDVDALAADARRLQGEFVLAVPSLDLSGLAGGGAFANGPSARNPAVTIAAMYQAGASADAFQSLLDRVFALSKSADGQRGLDVDLPMATPGTTTWLRRHRDDKGSVTLSRDGDLFSLVVTTYPAALATGQSLAALPLDDSFNAADLVRATPDSAVDGGAPFAELFVNLAPVWSAVALALPPEAKEPLANSGVTNIGGVSLTASLGAKGIDESLLFHSPGGRDLLSRFLASRPLVSAVTRWLPADFADSSIFTLDFAALFDGVRSVVPAPARKAFDEGLAQLKRETGIDLRGDVFANVGPTVAVASHGSFDPAASGGDFEWVCAIDLQDAGRARRALDKFLRQSGLAAAVRNETIEEFPASSTELPPFPTPLGQPLYLTPAWLIDDHALVLASKPGALRKAAVAAKESHATSPLRVALDGAGDAAFAVSTCSSDAEGVATVGRRTPAGLVVGARGGRGLMTTGAAVWSLAVGAAVALPKMIETRVAANEDAAVETLRAIWKAQVDVRSSQMLDLDNDGKGEFGTLAELAGTMTMRGRTAPAPVLDRSFAPDKTGVLLRGGYLFRVDLPTKTGGGVAVVSGAVASTRAADGPSTVSNDLAEQQFVAYAWPALPQGAGSRAFVIDQTGVVYFTKNDGAQQNYGTSRAPKYDAALLRDPSDRVKGVTAVRRGHDDGIWLEYR
jgi:hypothetical protein